MRNIDERTITPAVLAAMAAAPNRRLLEVMTSLVGHLHDFARETALTEDEWFAAIRFLTDVGRITDDTRQEFILLSDVLGLSMLVTAQNNRKPAACTESTVLGPFFVSGAPQVENGADIANGAPGAPSVVSGRVLSLDGAPIGGATVDVWQSDEDGFYDVQIEDVTNGQARARAQLRSDSEGRFHFRSVLPEHYPIPHDGPVGALLAALGRHPWRPAHLHFLIEAPGHERLITHLFRQGDEYLDSDAVFGVRSSLVVEWVRHDGGSADGGPWYSLDHDFVLNPTPAA
jgi:hydroxyquinol 1,2-dioxygenase